MKEKIMLTLVKYSKILIAVGAAVGILYGFSTWLDTKTRSIIRVVAREEADAAIRRQLVVTALENQKRLTTNQYLIYRTLLRHMDRDAPYTRIEMGALIPPVLDSPILLLEPTIKQQAAPVK